MGFNHTLGITYRTAAGTITSTTDVYTADSEVNSEVSVPSGNNKEVDITLVKTAIKSMVMICDKAVTVKTNNAISPQESIALAANKALIWNTDHTEVIPFAANVTKFFIDNEGNNSGNFKGYFLCDLTP